MSGLSSILETARKALASQRMAMNVTSHNIANVNTPGYSRQRADLVATQPLRTTFGYLGTGVTVQGIERIRDRFIDQQVRAANDGYGYATAQHGALSQIEAILGEPSDNGLGAVMGRFFNSFQQLATHPEESAPRAAVQQAGVALVQTFHRLSASLNEQRASVAGSIHDKVNRINQLSADISQLNTQIGGVIGQGNDPGDLRDQRDLKVDELSTLINITASEDRNGMLMVSSGGSLLVAGEVASALQVSGTGTSLKVVSSSTNREVSGGSGELGGLLDLHNNALQGYQNTLDQLASALSTRVNTLHSQGHGLGNPPPTGITFFTGTTASSLEVDAAILASTNNIAASLTGEPGDNGTALALAAVATEPAMDGNTVSVTQFYSRFVSTIGSATRAAEASASANELVLTQLENQREAVSGVSIDEEMTNLIKYQRAFEAAAKVVNTTDQLFQSILEMV